MIKKIAIDELQPGMEVVRLSSEVWEHLPFLYTEPGPITSEKQVNRIRSEGYLHAFIQTVDAEPMEKKARPPAQRTAADTADKTESSL